jgi:hypothetical protein
MFQLGKKLSYEPQPDRTMVNFDLFPPKILETMTHFMYDGVSQFLKGNSGM